MLSLWSLFCYALVVLVVYPVLALIRSKRHNRREAAKRGCLPPPKAPDRGLWGINTLRESIKATREGWGPVWMHQNLNQMGKHVHTVRAQVFDYEILITRDTDNIKAMLHTQAADFDLGPHRRRTFKSAYGLGVMTSQGNDWKHSRNMVRPQFGRSNVANLAMFERHVQTLLKRLRTGLDSWTSAIDMQPLFQNFTIDTGTEFLYGQSIYTQDPDARAKLPISWDPKAPDVANLGYHFDETKRCLEAQGALAKYSWLARSNAFSNHVKALNEFVDYFVEKKLNEKADEEKQVESSNSTQDKFVLLDELAKETNDPLRLRSETLNILHASRDTTGALMGWCIYFLARHPDAYSKVRAEVVSKFPDASKADDFDVNEIWSCRSVVNVINETIRYAAVVPMNERTAMTDTTLPTGGGPDGKSPIFVPKGRQVLIPAYSLQHREDIWGSDVEEWKPDRWEGRKMGWEFVPFGGGVRQCLGQQFARTEAMYVLIRLIQTFDKIENMEPPGSPINFHHTIENRSGTGVQVRLHAATPVATKASDEDYCNLEFEAERRESVGEI